MAGMDKAAQRDGLVDWLLRHEATLRAIEPRLREASPAQLRDTRASLERTIALTRTHGRAGVHAILDDELFGEL